MNKPNDSRNVASIDEAKKKRDEAEKRYFREQILEFAKTIRWECDTR